MGLGTDAKNRMQSWLREPLVHFLLAGFAVFLFSAWRGEPVDPTSRTIAIDEAQVDELAQRFAQSWRRSPTTAEIDGLIRDHIKEEIYYREALRLGLDGDDAIIRQRLRSKMEYLATSEIENTVPDEKTLQKWLSTHAARYSVGATYSFDQIYLKATNIEPDRLKTLMAKIAQAEDWQKIGDAISLPRSMESAEASEIARQFGDDFALALTKLSSGTWAGPVPSGFGSHIVRIRTIKPGRQPMLSEIRQRVENDWRTETVKQREAKAYQTLLDGYTIRIQKP